MTATKTDIIGWLEKAQQMGATHLIVAVDTYNYDNYPVYVMPDEDVKEEYDKFNGKNMQSVDEVYNLSMDIEFQLTERRAFHF